MFIDETSGVLYFNRNELMNLVIPKGVTYDNGDSFYGKMRYQALANNKINIKKAMYNTRHNIIAYKTDKPRFTKKLVLHFNIEDSIKFINNEIREYEDNTNSKCKMLGSKSLAKRIEDYKIIRDTLLTLWRD